jgi:2-keto-4-pentenoate hydratase
MNQSSPDARNPIPLPSSSEIAAWGRRIHGPTLPGKGVSCLRETPLSHAELEEITGIIVEARLNHRLAPDYPDHLKTRNWDSVMAVIMAVNNRLAWPAVGWKVGAASEEIRRVEKVPGPCPGQIALKGLYQSPARLPDRCFIRYRCSECEFAFRMGADLPARKTPYTESEVADAVESLHPALEIGDCVFEDWYGSSGYFGGSMDNGGAAAFVPGAPIYNWRHLDLPNAKIDLYLNGQYQKSGYGRVAMGHPLTSLTWMVNWLRERGLDLHAGEYVSTGTCTGHFFAARGDRLDVYYGEIGMVSVVYD